MTYLVEKKSYHKEVFCRDLSRY